MSTANPQRQSSPKCTLAVNDQIKGQPLRRFVLVIVFSLLLLIGSTRAFGAAEVVRGKLVSVTQSAPHTFNYAFALVVSNGAPALNSATITASTRSREIQVIQAQVSLGPIPANSETVTAGTIVLQVHERDDDYFEKLSFTVVPGPGPVAQGTITAATGGTIAVTDPGDPLFGTQVVFAPGVLGDPTDTITIGYSNVLPAPFDPSATAAGLIPVSKVITLDRTGSTPFNDVVQVTMPYSNSVLKGQDFPLAVYWDVSLGMYQPLQVVSVNQSAGTVTYLTKHFSAGVLTVIPGLESMLAGSIPFSPKLQHVDSGFRIDTNGFEVANFTTQFDGTANGADGVCYALTSFAGWYFTNSYSAVAGRPDTTQPLYMRYATQTDTTSTGHIAEEDAMARELLARAYLNSFVPINNKFFADLGGGVIPPPDHANDIMNAALLIQGLVQWPNTPQLVEMLQNTSLPAGNETNPAHSVMVYSWDATNLQFGVYDPSLPFPLSALSPATFQWTAGVGFSPYQSAWSGVVFPYIYYDARGSHFDPTVYAPLFTTYQTSPLPGPLFANLSIANLTPSTPAAYPGPPYATYQVNPTTGGSITYIWSDVRAAGNKNGSYLYVYQDGTQIGPTPIVNGTTATIQVNPFSRPTSEVIAFVSQDAAGSETDQSDIRHGYDAYLRVQLTASPLAVNWTTPPPPTSTAGTPFTLAWTAVAASTCNLSTTGDSTDGWAGTGVATTGSRSVTEPAAGTFTYTVQCFSPIANQPSAQISATVLVNASRYTITAVAGGTTDNLTVNTAMAPFSPFASVTGGTLPYTYILSGSLPAGLGFNTVNGTVTGTPTAVTSGTTVTFSVEDSTGQVASVTNAVTFVVTSGSCILTVPSQISGTVNSHLADAYFSLVQGAWTISISGPGQCVQSGSFGGYMPAGSVTASASVTITVTPSPGTGGGSPNSYSFSDVVTGITATVDLTGCYRFSLFKSVTTFPVVSGLALDYPLGSGCNTNNFTGTGVAPIQIEYAVSPTVNYLVPGVITSVTP